MKSAPTWKAPGRRVRPHRRLPAMSRKEFEEFLRKHQQAREQKERHVRTWATDRCHEFSIPFPWVDDHNMEQYVEKIGAAIDNKASGH